MLENLKTSVQAVLYERVSNPLISTFVIAWCLWNHRILVVLFSAGQFEEKFQFIDGILYHGSIWYLLLFSFVLPAASVAAYLIWPTPFLSKYFYARWKKDQQKIIEIKFDIEERHPLDEEQAILIKQKSRDMESRYEALIEEKDQKISWLTDENKKLTGNIINNEALEKQLSQLGQQSASKDRKVSELQSTLRDTEEKLKASENLVNQLKIQKDHTTNEIEKLTTQVQERKSRSKKTIDKTDAAYPERGAEEDYKKGIESDVIKLFTMNRKGVPVNHIKLKSKYAKELLKTWFAQNLITTMEVGSDEHYTLTAQGQSFFKDLLF